LRDTTPRGARKVEKTQHAANVSLAWFEHMKRYWGMDPLQFAFGVMSRSKQITWENLELRDPAFVRDVQRWFAVTCATRGSRSTSTIRRCRCSRRSGCADGVENRVVVSPMDQYSAVDGVPNDWHFVHLRAARSAAPGSSMSR
jgi:anthraniloyl-CoA monooxygenase